MRLDILYGRAGSGKTHECIEKIKKLIAMGEKCVMIVPEQFCYRTEKLLISQIGAISAQTAEVLTFTRLAGRIFAQNSGAVKLPLSAAGKNMLIYRAILSSKSNLRAYSLAAEKSGFADKVMTMISEFKRYGILPEDVEKISNEITKPNLAAKLCDLALIYKKYEDLFLDSYSDFEDNLYIAAELLGQGDYLKNVHIFIDEFTDFLPQHYKMIESLCMRASDMTLCLCTDKTLSTSGTFAPATRTYHKIKAMCNDINVPFSANYIEQSAPHIQSKELVHLEKNYTKISPEIYDDKTKDILVFESLNVYSEIEAAAKRILVLVRDNGARWRDISVCCGDSEMYFEPIKTIFARYEIPCFLAEKSDISSHPLVLTILSALDVLISGFSYESVFTYLKTGFANITMDECDILENYVLATGATKRAWLDEKVWSYKNSMLDDESGENAGVDEIRRRVIAPIMKLRENIGSKHTAAHACEAIYNFVCELGMDKKTQKLIDEFKDSGELVRANMYTRIWNSIIGILDQIVLTTGDKKIGMEQLRNLLETGFLKEQMGIIPQLADAVSVVDVPNMRAQECEYLFALGTNTGAFALGTSMEGILTDAEREVLEQMGMTLAPTVRMSLFDADFLIYKALTRPAKKLFLSYPLSKMDGSALAESQLCRDIKNIFSSIHIEDDFNQTDDEFFLGSPESTFGELIRRLGDNYNKEKGLVEQVYLWYKSNEKYGEKLDRLENALLYSSEAMTLLPRQTETIYKNGINSSVSRLERYSKCPFSYFIEYTLKAKERKILKIGAPDIGSIIHLVLERFTKIIAQDNVKWTEISEEYVEATVSSIMDDMSEKMLNSSALANRSTQYILQRIRRNLVRCVKLLIMHIASGRFEPAGSEVEFGDNGEISAVIVDLTSGKKLKIHGKIDRIDKCETSDGTYYRVVDYKSGSKTFSLGNIYNKLDLQLVVYLDAAMNNKKDAKPAGMLYFNVREPMIKASSLMSDEEAAKSLKDSMKLNGLLLNDVEIMRDMDRNFEQGSEFLPITMNNGGEMRITSTLATMSQFKLLSDYVKKALKQIGNKIINGNIDIMPYKNNDSSSCSYCAYKPVCKFDISKSKKGYRMCEKTTASTVWDMIREDRG